MSEPIREQPTPTRCVCRLRTGTATVRRYSNGVETTTTEPSYDECRGLTSGPDEPFCQHCQDNEHPTHPNQDPTIKNTQRRSNL